MTDGRLRWEKCSRGLPEGHRARQTRSRATRGTGVDLITLPTGMGRRKSRAYGAAHALCRGASAIAGRVSGDALGASPVFFSAPLDTAKELGARLVAVQRADNNMRARVCSTSSSSAPRTLAPPEPAPHSTASMAPRHRLRSDRLVDPCRAPRSHAGWRRRPPGLVLGQSRYRQRLGPAGHGGARPPGTHPFSLGLALCFLVAHQLRREVDAVAACADEVIALARAPVPQLARLGRGPVRLGPRACRTRRAGSQDDAGRIREIRRGGTMLGAPPCCCSSPRPSVPSAGPTRRSRRSRRASRWTDTERHAWEGWAPPAGRRAGVRLVATATRRRRWRPPSPTRTRPTRSPMSCDRPRRWCRSKNMPHTATRQTNISAACFQASRRERKPG